MFVRSHRGGSFSFTDEYQVLPFVGGNPFGFSSQNPGSPFKRLVKDASASFKHLRRMRHRHHSIDDAKGNAEALLHMKEVMGLKIKP
jgi:hypothetical protein